MIIHQMYSCIFEFQFNEEGDKDISITFVLGYGSGKIDCTFTWVKDNKPEFKYETSGKAMQVTPASPYSPDIQGDTANVTVTCRE